MDASTLFGNHLEDCDKCRPHRGHLPFGLCPEGQTLFEKINEDLGTAEPPTKCGCRIISSMNELTCEREYGHRGKHESYGRRW